MPFIPSLSGRFKFFGATYLPSLPVNLTFTSVTSSGFTVSWQGGTGSLSYAYKLNGILTTPSVDNGILSQSATFTGLTGGSVYSVIVIAINTAGSRPSSLLPNTKANTRVWYDASNPIVGSAVPATGTPITTWYDKSGNSNTNAIVINSSVAPTLENDGLYYVSFNGNASQQLLIADISWVPDSFFTIFTVELTSSLTSGNQGIFGSTQSAGTNGALSIRWSPNKYFIGFYNNDQESATLFTTTPPSSPYLVSYTLTTGNNRSIYVNGSLSSTEVILNRLGSNLGSLVIANNLGSNPYSGSIREIIGYYGSISNQDRQAIEGYLAWKWNIQGNLSASHPYLPKAPEGTLVFVKTL